MGQLALSVLILANSQEIKIQPDCLYDQKILSLSFQEFDQRADGGWRDLANQPGCKKKAADIIKAYRQNSEQQLSTLYWHEAQLRAESGAYSQAISLMEKTLKQDDFFAWNPYVRATIAFLKNRKGDLKRQRKALANSPPPENWTVEWPHNLDVVDGLIRCFGKPYQEAYSRRCRQSKSPNRSAH